MFDSAHVLLQEQQPKVLPQGLVLDSRRHRLGSCTVPYHGQDLPKVAAHHPDITAKRVIGPFGYVAQMAIDSHRVAVYHRALVPHNKARISQQLTLLRLFGHTAGAPFAQLNRDPKIRVGRASIGKKSRR
jgi:hypothetical protein